MKRIIRSILMLAAVMTAVFMFQGTGPGESATHFESMCDTLISGTDTIVNCYVRCASPPRATDTAYPLGEFKFVEAVVKFDTTTASWSDSLKFQLWAQGIGWYDVKVWDLTTASVTDPFPIVTGGVSAVKRYRLTVPGPLKPRVIQVNSKYLSGRKDLVKWEGYTE